MYGDYDPLGEIAFTKERKPMSEKSQKPVKFRVTGPWQVVHDGKRYTEGQEATVPEHLAEERERSRWVERVTSKG